MFLPRITTLKQIFLLTVLCAFMTSCEPESLPNTDSGNNTSVKLYSDSGNEINPPETRN